MPIIEALDKRHVKALAALHAESLAGDFLPSLGTRFLEVLYDGMLALDLAWGFVASEGPRVVGFVIGTDDSRGLFTQLVKGRVIALSLQVARALLRRPSLLLPTLETFLYPGKEHLPGVHAELLTLAVAADQRSAGVGAALVQQLDTRMRGRDYKLTVLGHNERAQRFYERLGFEHVDSFTLYRKPWKLYRRRPPQQ